ncbi:AzlC family ABC transporter permease [Shouchella sp. JSM 1781072]|uniref:AzlC family ABC transporter permease n=1 Tax=Bacillaceae TaxID=186817 RepID=UPI0020D0F4D2|nr:AzlC family ABC transporter permease [Alkalihalobacillus sp. LMS6]UTR07182.1 AzlC family ABC transporter permease [Alkalihalobacillus sp. LMS6]
MVNRSLKEALADGLPVAIAIASYGVSYGILANQADFSVIAATVMSLLLFAGSVQLVAVAMYVAGATVPAILFAAFLLNLRDFLYGMDLSKDLGGMSKKWRFLSVFGVSDEPYFLAKARFATKGTDLPYFFTVTLLFYIAWVISSFLGVWVGDQIDPLRFGLDLAFPAAFTALLMPALTHIAAWVTVAVAIIITLSLEWLYPGNSLTIIISALIAPLVGIQIKRKVVRDD